MKEEEIINAYCKIREIDCSIPDDVLDFMKYASIKEIRSTIPFLSIIENVALSNQIKELQSTIEAQEIIIKDKLAIMEAIAQPKRCFDCKDKSDCYSYKCLTEDQTYMMSCPMYELKVQP